MLLVGHQQQGGHPTLSGWRHSGRVVSEGVAWSGCRDDGGCIRNMLRLLLVFFPTPNVVVGGTPTTGRAPTLSGWCHSGRVGSDEVAWSGCGDDGGCIRNTLRLQLVFFPTPNVVVGGTPTTGRAPTLSGVSSFGASGVGWVGVEWLWR